MADLIPVGYGLRNFSGMTGVSRYLREVARRLPQAGFEARIATRRHGASEKSLAVSQVPWIPLTSWSRAASFDYFARRRLKSMGARLVHGLGDLTRQDIVSVNNCDAAAARYVPDGRKPSAGVDYVRRGQFSPEGSRVIIAISDLVRRDVVEFYGVPPEKIVRLYFGVDLDKFHPRRRSGSRARLLSAAGWPEETKVVLSVLSGDPAKRNFSLLARAVERLSEKHPAALCVVGNIPWQKDEAAARLAGKKIFHHVPATPQVEDYYAAADAFALPAHYEEFGLTVLEALASGCPVVSSRRCGASELLVKGYNGDVFDDMNDPEELSELLRGILFSGGGYSGARATAEKYSWEKHVTDLTDIYRKLL